MKLLKRISFILLVIILIVLVTATILEKMYGSSFVSEYIYGSVSFVVLWLLLAVFSIVYLLKKKVQRSPVVMTLHFSFLLILTGAFVTWLSGEQGLLHLRKNQEANFFIDNKGVSKEFPFVIKLNDFHITYYTGTHAPMDFISSVTVSDAERGQVVKAEVSMNNIFSYRGYRFYQSGYDENEEGAVLAVSHDPYGIAVTYSGYALLLFSFLSFFFSRHSRFRRLLKNPLLIRGVTVSLLLFVFMISMSATESSAFDRQKTIVSKPKVLPKEIAAEFCDLYVLYNDRICPLQTVAKDFTVKLYGSPSYKGYTSEQVFTGWMFFYSSWKEQPVIKIKSKIVRQLLGTAGRYASLDDFYDKYNAYKLEGIVRKIHLGEDAGDRRGIEEANEKYNLITIFYSGKLLKIFPIQSSDGNGPGSSMEGHNVTVNWYSQGDVLPDDMAGDEWFFVRKSFDYIHEMVVKKDYNGVSDLLMKLKIYQQKKAGNILPSNGRFKAEKIYNNQNYTRLIAMLCILIGLLSFLFCCNRLIHSKKMNENVERGLCLLAVVIFLYLSLLIGLRWYISGHVPLSNGSETMQFMAWCSLLLSLFLRKKIFLLLPFGFLLCGLTLLVSVLGEANPRITQLIPVLSSPLLSIHVVVIMIAYALFAFIMLNGVTAVILFFVNKKNFVQIEHLHIVSRIILYPAIFFLAVGIFVGAVWANISWGRYWGWDPKEVWALITMLIYSFAIHSDSLPWLRRPMFFHVFVVMAFLSVLITYFGVNFILGGIHSYA